MQSSEIIEKIRATLPDATVEVQDLTGGGDHFEALIVSKEFDGKNSVNRHRLIYGILQEEMKGAIHALTLKTFTPEEYRSNS